MNTVIKAIGNENIMGVSVLAKNPCVRRPSARESVFPVASSDIRCLRIFVNPRYSAEREVLTNVYRSIHEKDLFGQALK